MRLLVLSDLHFEFHWDTGHAFVESLPESGVDVCVLAGDIAVGADIPDALGLVCRRYPHVVYVHGNHEMYGCSRPEVLAFTQSAAAMHKNLHWLDCSSVEIGGLRFLGAPLWFEAEPAAPKAAMNDFRLIRDLESWVYSENRRASAYFANSLTEADVVVTHHLPTMRSISEDYKDSPLISFFVSDQESLIVRAEPTLWIHGHTHDSLDYRIGRTRMLCNPFGYARIGENQGFDPSLVIEL